MPGLLHKVSGVLVLFTVMAFASCGDETRFCYDGDYRACSCEDGAFGYQACQDDEYGACNCETSPPGFGGGAPATGAGGGGGGGGEALLPFMSPCDSDEQCDTGLCHLFNAKGPHCSKPCVEDGDCEAPSPGCNLMGICKAP